MGTAGIVSGISLSRHPNAGSYGLRVYEYSFSLGAHYAHQSVQALNEGKGGTVTYKKKSGRPGCEFEEVGTVLVLLVHDVLEVVGAPSRALRRPQQLSKPSAAHLARIVHRPPEEVKRIKQVVLVVAHC